ncbi:MAG: hypothetical protein ACREE6_12820, partial [Limisphaerales bacterium]
EKAGQSGRQELSRGNDVHALWNKEIPRNANEIHADSEEHSAAMKKRNSHVMSIHRAKTKPAARIISF